MLNDQLKKLSGAWLTAQGHPNGPSEDEWPAIFEVIELSRSEPDVVWQFILSVLKLQPSEAALGMLAAGPLEDLIQDHGEDFIDRIAAEAEKNGSFAALLPKVWIPDSADPVTIRFVQLGCDTVAAAV